MTEQEKDLLLQIPILRMETKSMLKTISYLMNNTKQSYSREIDKCLDRIKMLDELEKELLKKKNN